MTLVEIYSNYHGNLLNQPFEGSFKQAAFFKYPSKDNIQNSVTIVPILCVNLENK